MYLFYFKGGQVSDVVNSRNIDDQTALDVACHFSQENGVRVLLEAGADVNHVEGHTKPIHTALKSNGTRCAALILEFHPEQINEKDLKYGALPLHWAKTKEVK
jgi:ankyrin repeat protein